MTLTGKILNSEAELNSFKLVGSVDFMPGADLTLKFMLFNPEEALRYIPGAAAVVKVTLPTINGELEKTASFLDAGDRSLIVLELSQAETEDLTGGNLTFEIDELGDGSVISKGYISAALRRITAGEACC